MKSTSHRRFAPANRKSKIGNRKSEMASTRRRPLFESLELRAMMAGDVTLSISDATAVEGSSTLKLLDRFVHEGSGGLVTPRNAVFGPDANTDSMEDLYVPSAMTDEVLLYDGVTGAFIDAFVTAGSGGLNGPAGIGFGSDGNFYVVGNESNDLLRYDGQTGAFIDQLVTGLNKPVGLTIAPDGAVLVANQFGDEIVRYSGTGVSAFVPAGSGGLARPRNAVFGPDGNGDGVGDLYVSSQNSNQVLRYNGLSGAFLGVFAAMPGTLTGPNWIEFGSDGFLYATARTTSVCCETSIAQFDGSTGAFVDVLHKGTDGWSFVIGSDGLIYNSSNGGGNYIDRFGLSSLSAFTVSLSEPSAVPVTVNYSTTGGSATSGSDFVGTSGTLTFAPGQTSRTILVQTLDDAVYEGHESFVVNLSNSIGGVISDSQGVGTIVDNDPAPQISISDGTASEGSSAFKFIDSFVPSGSGGLSSARSMAYGPDGNIYIASLNNDSILRYDAQTGAFLDAFVPSGSGGLDSPWAVTFGPDGNLYVSGLTTRNVLRFNGTTGAFIDEYVPVGASSLKEAKGLLFGPDGNLYVSNSAGHGGAPGPHTVLRFGGPLSTTPKAPLPAPGQSGAVFVADGSGGLNNPNGLAFGPDGHLYVANAFADSVNRYSAATGSFMNTFVGVQSGGLDTPSQMQFRSDGLLYVTSQSTDQVLRYNAATGAFVDAVIAAGSGGLDSPNGMLFDSAGSLFVSSTITNSVLRYASASTAAFHVTLSAPATVPVTVNYSTAGGGATSGSDFTAISGTLTFAPGQTSRTILVQTLDDALYEGPETFIVNLSNPVGGVITDGQGVGTIGDDDPMPTKFYVVDDASANQTFEYGTSGSAIENYGLNSGNTAPRGAASTAAGDKLWVVDSNKKVYVYNTSGGLLGSWTANSLPSNANVQGVTTNGTDVWIVDAQGDKVYRYTGAASRLSGSQNAASSFNLNTSNKDATDLVTDGTSIWVLNNTSTDKVFKYTVSGSLQGSWTINGGGGSPTGLTIDPSGASSSIWIVDSSSDRVYEYASARSRTSDSQSPTTSFALAAGNTNPQGIADPPTAGVGNALRGIPQTQARGAGQGHALSTHDSALLELADELGAVLGGKKRR